jgi:hypothetical protein
MTAQVVEPTRHMDINRPPGEIGAPKTQYQPSFTLPTFRGLNDHSMVHDRNFQRDGAMTGRARHHPGEPGGLAGPRAQKTVSLALQGGGAPAPSRGVCSTRSLKTGASPSMRPPVRAPAP